MTGLQSQESIDVKRLIKMADPEFEILHIFIDWSNISIRAKDKDRLRCEHSHTFTESPSPQCSPAAM